MRLGKIHFDGSDFETARLTKGALLIYTMYADFSGNEKGRRRRSGAGQYLMVTGCTKSGFL
jgi:hypothetical protein